MSENNPAGGLDSKPNLNPNAATFIPTFLKNKVQTAVAE